MLVDKEADDHHGQRNWDGKKCEHRG
jgi:hypothetical protein